jgi:hypothetical protein
VHHPQCNRQSSSIVELSIGVAFGATISVRSIVGIRDSIRKNGIRSIGIDFGGVN